MAEKDGHIPSTTAPLISPLEDAASVGGLCSSHPGEPLAVYCRTCLALICTECMDDKHGEHVTKSVRKQLPLLKEEIAQTLPTLETRVTEQKLKLKLVNATIEREEEEFATELGDREEQQRDAVAQLEGQYRKLQEELEKDFTQKKEALQEHMTLGYEREMTARIEELTEARDQLMAECEDLDNIIADCCSRLDDVEQTSKDDPSADDQEVELEELEALCGQLTVSDVVAVLPQLKSLNESDPTCLPDEHPALPPLSVPGHMKNFYAQVTKDEENYLGLIQALELMKKPAGATTVYLHPDFIQSCKEYSEGESTFPPTYYPMLHPDKAYREGFLKLTKVSAKAGTELARLFGGGDVLVRETRHKGEVFRTTTGTVTHVRANVGSIFRDVWYWLPAGVSVVEAVRLAGVSCSRVTDYGSNQDVTNTNTLAWCDSSPGCYLNIKKLRYTTKK